MRDSLTLSLSLSLSDPLHRSEREREREREMERERDREKERDVEYGSFKRNDRCLGTIYLSNCIECKIERTSS